MNDIELVKELDLGAIEGTEPPKEVTEIYNGERRRILEITLRGGAVLPRHHAAEPITVLCLAGSGTFRAGAMLESSHLLVPGSLITVEAGVDHDVTADPAIRLLVTRFKQ